MGEQDKDCCENWAKGIVEINGFISIGRVHGMKYEAPPFKFCPWCGSKLED